MLILILWFLFFVQIVNQFYFFSEFWFFRKYITWWNKIFYIFLLLFSIWKVCCPHLPEQLLQPMYQEFLHLPVVHLQHVREKDVGYTRHYQPLPKLILRSRGDPLLVMQVYLVFQGVSWIVQLVQINSY